MRKASASKPQTDHVAAQEPRRLPVANSDAGRHAQADAAADGHHGTDAGRYDPAGYATTVRLNPTVRPGSVDR